MSSPNRSASGPQPARIIGSGEMAERVRAFNWAATPLGPIETWSRELTTIVNLTLCSPSPARTMWGPELILIYNDAYRPIPGRRHPEALGCPAKEVYREAWHVVGPLLETALLTGETFYYEKLVVPLETEQGVQDFYLNYSFNPIYEAEKVAGLFGPLQDVTGEVTAVRRLRESEARASRILQSIGDAVIVTDGDIAVTAMNVVAEQLTGWQTADALGKPLAHVFRIVSERTHQPVESPAHKVKATVKVVGLANHTLLIARDGKETPIDDSAAPILDDDGALTGVVLVFRDITQRREAERERELLAEQLSQMLDVTTDAIVSVDRNWVMTYLNPRAITMYAAGRQLRGQNLWEAFPDAAYDGSPYVESYRRAMNQGIPGSFDAFYPEPLNVWLHVDVYSTPDGIVTYSRDITQERALLNQLSEKREEAERQRSEIESVYQTAPIGLALFDVKDFRYLRLNKRQADFFGLTPKEVVGRTLTEMAPIEKLKDLFEQVLQGTPVINYPLEGELVTRPGEQRYWLVSYFPVLGPDGTVQAITAATLEVTQQKKAEHALIESEKLAVVGRLASSIAHEINNPLESVTNLLYLAGMSEDLTEVRGRLDSAQRELRRVAAITSQTLRFHKQATKPTAVTAEELMDSVVLMYQGRIVNARIQIEARYRARRPVRCFEGEIRQVLSNLINNATDAMGSAGGRLLLRSRSGVDWATRRQGLVLTVADTGGGMSQAVLGRIFEPFFTTKGAVGTGLGLWVSLEIVKRHSGTLRCRSSQKVGHCGTVFTVFLPFDGVTGGNKQ